MVATAFSKHHLYAIVAGIPFSVPAFVRGLIVVGILLLGLIFWLSLNARQTHLTLAERAPGKMAVIQRDSTPAIIVKNEGDTKSLDHISATALPPAPIDGLFEETPMGKAPIARPADGATPFESYRRPFTPAAGKHPVSITLYGMGISEKMTRTVITDFPADVSLAFDPGVSISADLAGDARAHGHETWLVLPMQGDAYPSVDPGPDALLLNSSLAQTKDRVLKNLTRLTGYAGAVTPPDHAYQEDVLRNNNVVMEQVFGRGLAVVDTRTDRPFFAESMAKEYEFPYGKADFWLNPDMDADAIKAVLTALEKHASDEGGATLFAVATPLTTRYLKGWIDMLADKPFQLAPLSARVNVDVSDDALETTDSHTPPATADINTNSVATPADTDVLPSPPPAPVDNTHHE